MNNYEKKYKEALAKARRLHDEPTGGTERIVCEQIFPELMGSEDERIRKWLEEHIEAMPYNSIEFKDVKRIDVLYWLEMQGEQKFSDGTFVNVDDVREDFVNEVYRVLDADSTNDRANQIIDAFDNLPTIELEKQCEQMPADKVEPKFKVGDTMRTLQEAKDGRTDGMPFVVSIDSEYYNCNSEKIAIKDQDDYEYPPMNRKQKPAEEYNITGIGSKNAQGKLGEMIKEMENRNKVEPKFKAGDWIVRELDNSVHQVKAVIENISNGKYGYDLTRGGYISTSQESDYRLWTIQDAKAGDVLVASDGSIFLFGGMVDYACKYYVALTTDNVIKVDNMLEHYWETARAVHPSTKEQRDTLMKAMTDAGYTFDFEKKELKKIEYEIEIPYGAKDSELIEESYYIPKGFHAEIDKDKVVIKKGEKPTAWSEEDKVILDEIIDFFENGTVKLQHDLSLYASWLKSLRPKSQWKPSDAQMIVLNDVITNGHLSNANERILKGLQEQLKKLK